MYPTRSTAWHRFLAVSAVFVAVFALSVPSAFAHEGETSDKASDLVRQAIAVMVNEPDNTAAVDDKLNDATNATDQAGVDPKELAAARDAMAAGDMHRARALAEVSIGAQPHRALAEVPAIGETTPTTVAPSAPMPGSGMPVTTAVLGNSMTMAAGAETGQASFADPLDVRPGLTGRDWAVLGLSLAAGLTGIYLTVRFRPPHREVQP